MLPEVEMNYPSAVKSGKYSKEIIEWMLDKKMIEKEQ